MRDTLPYAACYLGQHVPIIKYFQVPDLVLVDHCHHIEALSYDYAALARQRPS